MFNKIRNIRQWFAVYIVDVPLLKNLVLTGISATGIGFILFVMAMFWPMHSPQALAQPASTMPAATSRAPVNIETLIAKTAGMRLIRPSSALAAVKDNGIAKKLLARMKLQGVTELGGAPIAYINIEKMGTQTVKVGDSVLDFQVQAIAQGQVTLNLDGVVVELRY